MPRQAWLLLTVIGLAVVGALPARAQKLIEFDRNDPEIRTFRQRSPGGESSAGGNRMPSLALPVLDFRRPPVAGLGGFESTKPARRAVPIYRRSDPTTYTMRHVYDDVVILVSGDLKIQNEVEESASGDAASSLVIETADIDPGAEDTMARVVFYKYRIPYTIEVECGEKRLELCRSEEQLRTLAGRLGLISVPRSPR
jgi:hypothetical protein